MPKINKPLRVGNVRVRTSSYGTYTEIGVSDSTRGNDGNWTRAYFDVVVSGDHSYLNQGDSITIKVIEQVKRQEWQGKTYVKIYGQVDTGRNESSGEADAPQDGPLEVSGGLDDDLPF